ncbi:hypothetical protein PG1C_00255 [Rugosibacter aromaticivorans]|uniref:DUF484 family protein n=2 Tax=Rugosibacter aromaticivorans TaxID=1565605 RepID=A0A0C5JBT1_9PROT|nr:hypothetical protein PG1C_00255 [Rugosibacter aromaticivorans]TBR14152.1 MAG: DUF484 family protein [Rugosibacter sp.]
MSAEAVARYLHDHPEFFDAYTDVLALMTLPDPHTGRAISITEKQLFTLRDKVRTLEAKLAELITFGNENDAISSKVHDLAVALIAAQDEATMVRVIYSHLGGAFSVPHVALRVWNMPSSLLDAVTDTTKIFAAGLKRPLCGPAAEQESVTWFGEAAAHLRSMAQVPLRDAHGACFGLLVMASEEAHRFYPALGTLYLERIGDMASAALQRVLGASPSAPSN